MILFVDFTHVVRTEREKSDFGSREKSRDNQQKGHEEYYSRHFRGEREDSDFRKNSKDFQLSDY